MCCNKCYWYDQCDMVKIDICDDYTPVFSDWFEEKEYRKCLEEAREDDIDTMRYILEEDDVFWFGDSVDEEKNKEVYVVDPGVKKRYRLKNPD